MTDVRFDFAGRRVLVTGGSNGIGAGIARAFADAGAEVIITGTRASAAEYDGELEDYEYRPLRLTDADGIAVLAGSLERLDVLVNNAGSNFPGGRSEWEPDAFEESVAINLFGAFRMSLACRERSPDHHHDPTEAK